MRTHGAWGEVLLLGERGAGQPKRDKSSGDLHDDGVDVEDDCGNAV
jgi:hypothetical protein